MCDIEKTNGDKEESHLHKFSLGFESHLLDEVIAHHQRIDNADGLEMGVAEVLEERKVIDGARDGKP